LVELRCAYSTLRVSRCRSVLAEADVLIPRVLRERLSVCARRLPLARIHADPASTVLVERSVVGWSKRSATPPSPPR